MSLALGNKYMFSHSSQLDGSPNSSSWFTFKNIISDTMINEKTYYKFDDGSILRSDENAVYSFNYSEEKIYFNFKVKVGDIISFENQNLEVTEIVNENIFGENVLVVKFSNQFSATDTLFSYSFSKKYGVCSSSFKVKGYSTGYYLDGAIIDNVALGRLNF